MTILRLASALTQPVITSNPATGHVTVVCLTADDIAAEEWSVDPDEADKTAARLEMTGEFSFTDVTGDTVELAMSAMFNAAAVDRLRRNALAARTDAALYGGKP